MVISDNNKYSRDKFYLVLEGNVAKVIGIIVGLAIFGFWMNIVGNPHVVETTMGLIIAIGSGFWVYSKIKKF